MQNNGHFFPDSGEMAKGQRGSMRVMSVSINIQSLTKTFGDEVALNKINLEIKPGELFGFIGPDGSGKTTLFRLLTGLMLPNSGRATIDDLDIVKDYKKIRNLIGYMPGRFSLYADLSVEENLNFYASIFNTSLQENYDLIRDIYIHIEPFKKRKAGALSGGMKQKLALSCALIHKPKLLILDEPTTGVDAVSRKEFWELLKKMQQQNITILVSTPYMDEAALCDRVALMQRGNLLAVNSPQEITSGYNRKLFAVKTERMHPLLSDLEQLDQKALVYRFGENVHVSAGDEEDKKYIDTIRDFLTKQGHQQVFIKRQTPVIEDCFLALMDKSQVL